MIFKLFFYRFSKAMTERDLKGTGSIGQVKMGIEIMNSLT